MDASLNLIFGLTRQAALLHLDPLSLFFLVVLLFQGGATALAGMRASLGFWLSLAGMVLVLVSGTGFTLILGLGLMAAAGWYLAVRADPKQAMAFAGIFVFSIACLVPALALPVSSLTFLLILVAAAAMTGLAPFYKWLPRRYAALPEAMSALFSGGGVNIGFYILIRYVFITAARSQQTWWGVVLIVLGAFSILFGALKAALEVDLRDVTAWSTVAGAGFIALGTGLALQAEALGHMALAGLALQAVLLWILAHGLLRSLLFIGAGEVRQAVGTSSLNWLGGLMRGMPRLGALMLLGAAGLAMLPLGPAFAPAFLLMHAVVDSALQGGLGAHFCGAVLLMVLGLGAALLFMAVIKLIGLGFLGRPRSLHAAAAEDARHGPFLGMAMLGLLCVPIALVPGFILDLCAPVIRSLAPLATTTRLTYAPLTLYLLAGIALLVAGVAQARWGVRGLRETPAWTGGFDRPPAWLPFGDPHTQSSASGFVEPLILSFGQIVTIDPVQRFLWLPLLHLYGWVTSRVRRAGRPTPRFWLAVLFAAALLALLLRGLLQGG